MMWNPKYEPSVGFYSRNLWVSELTFVEQPDVQFKYKLLVYLRDRGIYII